MLYQGVQQGRPDDRIPVIQRSCLAQRFQAFAELPVEAQFLAALQPLFRLRGARQSRLPPYAPARSIPDPPETQPAPFAASSRARA